MHHSSWGSKVRYSCRVRPSWEPWFVIGMKCYWHFWQLSNELMASLSHFLLNSRITCIYNHGGYVIGMIILLYSWTTGTELLRIPRIFCIKIILFVNCFHCQSAGAWMFFLPQYFDYCMNISTICSGIFRTLLTKFIDLCCCGILYPVNNFFCISISYWIPLATNKHHETWSWNILVVCLFVL